MYKHSIALAFILLSISAPVSAKELSEQVAELRQMLLQVKDNYENRIKKLEDRLADTEQKLANASQDADQAMEIAEQTAISASAAASSPSTFNPAVGAVLIGRYGDIGAGWESIPGFIPGGELGPGGSGFSLGESELNLKANVDPNFFGNLTLALEDEDGETEVSLEEVWVQTTALPHGLTALGGRYFSGVGYLNKFHIHADDFADRPLPYQAFFGGQYAADGVQLRWIAPTPLLLEFGAELNWGNGKTSPDARTLFVTTGGDIGFSHSWQLGLSHLATDVVDFSGADVGAPDSEVFSGDSDLTGIDLVWKWAPEGNPTVHNFKLQAEYFMRDESGTFDGLPYSGDQDGWYLQGIWQFMQGWRAGYRHDVVSADNGPLFAGTILETPGRDAKRDSLILEWSPSEFSRLRMQFTDDHVLDISDSQIVLQYLMSIGAHGGHQF